MSFAKASSCGGALGAIALLCGAATAEPGPEYAESLQELTRAIGEIGYVYGAPIVELAIAEHRQTGGLAEELDAPHGVVAHFRGGRLADHEDSWLAPPEPDVLYSSAWLSLRDQPFIAYVPPMDAHWYSLQFQDYFTNDVGYLSTRTAGAAGGRALIAYQDWRGELPAGVEHVIRVPTPTTWMLARIAATARNQTEVHAGYQARIRLIPLDAYLADPVGASNAVTAPQRGVPPAPAVTEEIRGTLEVFRVINHHLRALDVPSDEAGLMALFDRAGFGPSQRFDPKQLPRPVRAGLTAAAAQAAQIVDDFRDRAAPGRNGWSPAPQRLGVYGHDYMLRATAAFGASGASLSEELVSARAQHDSEGRPLHGRHRYTLTFAAEQEPPAQAFWSFAAYATESRRLMANPLRKYSVSSAKGVRRNPDGSLTLFISRDPPSDVRLLPNWLPVKRVGFSLIGRIYAPEPAALDGSYANPPIVRVD